MIVAFLIGTGVLAGALYCCSQPHIIIKEAVLAGAVAITMAVFLIASFIITEGPREEGPARTAPGWETTTTSVIAYEQIGSETVVVTTDHSEVRWLSTLPKEGERIEIACGPDFDTQKCIEPAAIVHWQGDPGNLWWKLGLPLGIALVEILGFTWLCITFIKWGNEYSSSPTPFGYSHSR